MREVQVKIKFITPCLANERREDCDRFTRDTDGNIIFMSSWWRSIFEYGAQALGRHISDYKNILVHSIIEGVPSVYSRFYAAGKYKNHEAFLAGDIITIRIMLPSSIPYADLIEMMSKAGPFRGISPYRWSDGYGTFTVISDPDEYK